MPKPSIWMIRLSLAYLFISVMVGGIILSHKAIYIHPAVWGLLPMHFEFAIWGWLVQFVMGTAYWMFPKKLEGLKRGPENLSWIMMILYNSGVVILTISDLTSIATVLALTGRLMILLGILLFIGLVWQRVVSYQNQN